jgi:integrase
MAKKLTARSIELAKPRKDKKGQLVRTEIPDGGKPGLYLVIQPNGKKSWAVRYRRLSDGKPRKLTLDGFPSLGVAHKQAQAALDRVADGHDPAADKIEAKDAQTRAREAKDDLFPNVARLFISRYAKPKNRSWRETARLIGLGPEDPKKPETSELILIKGGIADKWRKRRVQEIKKRDILDLLDGIVDRGAGIVANRTLAALRKLFNWSVDKDIIEASPVASVKAPAPAISRDRILNDDEIKLFWSACEKIGYPFGHIGKLLLLTGQRLNEVAGMSKSEIDPDKRLWTIPRERAKNDERHIVPLSDAVIEIIDSIKPVGPKRLLFTTTGESSVSGFSRAKARLDANMGSPPDWRQHDLRRTVASGMAKLRIALPVIEKVLNHHSGSFAGIVGVYQHHDFADEKREAIEKWGAHVMALIGEQ